MGNAVDVVSKGLTALPDDALTDKVEEIKCDRNRISSLQQLSRLRNLKVLSASVNAIDSLAPLADLRALTSLDVTMNLLEDDAFRPLALLLNLTELRCEGNLITELGSLAALTKLEVLWCGCNRIASIEALRNLTHLREVAFARNDVTSLAPLEFLKKIASLSCEFNPVTIDSLSAIASLRLLRCSQDQGSVAKLRSALPTVKVQLLERRAATLETYAESKTITAANSNLTDIPPLPWASTSVDLSFNRLTSLAPLSNLSAATNLDLSSNQISHLAPLARLSALTHLSVGGNPIVSLAPLLRLSALMQLEVSFDQGNVGTLLSRRPHLAITFAPLKVVIIGSDSVGKSCLLKRHQDGHFVAAPVLDRAQAAVLPVYLPGSVGAKLHVWEANPLISAPSLAPPPSFRGAALVLCCFDCTSADAISSQLPKIFQEIKSRVLGSVSHFIVATKIDFINNRAISTEEGRAFAEANNAAYFETSAITGEGVQEVFNACARSVIERQCPGLLSQRAAMITPPGSTTATHAPSPADAKVRDTEEADTRAKEEAELKAKDDSEHKAKEEADRVAKDAQKATKEMSVTPTPTFSSVPAAAPSTAAIAPSPSIATPPPPSVGAPPILAATPSPVAVATISTSPASAPAATPSEEATEPIERPRPTQPEPSADASDKLETKCTTPHSTFVVSRAMRFLASPPSIVVIALAAVAVFIGRTGRWARWFPRH